MSYGLRRFNHHSAIVGTTPIPKVFHNLQPRIDIKSESYIFWLRAIYQFARSVNGGNSRNLKKLVLKIAFSEADRTIGPVMECLDKLQLVGPRITEELDLQLEADAVELSLN